MTLGTKRSQRYHTYVATTRESRISFPLALQTTASRFGVSGHFETSAANDPKITLNTKRSKVLYLQPQTSLNFALRPAGFELQGILRCTEWPQMTLNTKRSTVPHIHPIYMLQPMSPTFHPILLYSHPSAPLRSFISAWPWIWPFNGVVGLPIYGALSWSCLIIATCLSLSPFCCYTYENPPPPISTLGQNPLKWS